MRVVSLLPALLAGAAIAVATAGAASAADFSGTWSASAVFEQNGQIVYTTTPVCTFQQSRQPDQRNVQGAQCAWACCRNGRRREYLVAMARHGERDRGDRGVDLERNPRSRWRYPRSDVGAGHAGRDGAVHGAEAVAPLPPGWVGPANGLLSGKDPASAFDPKRHRGAALPSPRWVVRNVP